MPVTGPLLEEVRRRARFACEYCGVHETEAGGILTVDHYKPQFRGGADDADNLVYACFRCNTYKADYWASAPDEIPIFNPRIRQRSGVNPAVSRDQGRTFGSIVAVEASGYGNPTFDYDPGRGLMAVAMQESNQSWWITVGTLQSDGVTRDFATPVKLYNGGDKAFADLRLTPLGWFFISGYDGGTIAYLWCRALPAAAVGTWTSANMAGSAVVFYQNPTFCFDVQRNLLVTAIQAWGTTSSLAWYVVTGTLGSNGETWTFGTVRAIVVDGVAAEGPPTFADLEYSPEGGFTFLFVNASGSLVLARCRALERNGTRNWTAS